MVQKGEHRCVVRKTPIANMTRVYASVFDWLIGGIISGFPGVILYSILTDSNKPLKNLYMFEASGFSAGFTIFVACLCLFFGFSYYVFVPWRIFPGQTLGKRIFHLKIIKQNNQQMNFSDYVLRQFVFLVGIEGIATATSTYLRVIVTTAIRFYVDSYFNIAWSLITLISMFLVFGTHRHLALHDYAVNTMVVKN